MGGAKGKAAKQLIRAKAPLAAELLSGTAADK